ncbi:MAG: D-sedoheptulose 7-phosphate isomerase [Saprospiraceae bacterium]|nr:D-sedoheptulose 7-phosphate isomerase [Saprospiraceae bacterium]
MSKRVKNILQASADTKQAMVHDEALQATLCAVIDACVRCFQAGGKLLFAGNGGSAADAQHLAAELSGRFYRDRPPLFAEALHVNSSYLTAVANDYGYEQVYARMLEAAGQTGEVFSGISASGNSQNILAAIQKAKDKGMIIVGMTGKSGGKMADQCDYLLNVPSDDTPRIQECHILLGHILCEIIELKLFG